MALSDEELLALVRELSSDYNEDIGEFGGYVTYSIDGDVLTVKAQMAIDADGQQPLEATERSWQIVPAPAGGPVREVKFITWDAETDGIAVEHDGVEAWGDTAHDGWSQYFRHHMPKGVPVLLDSDTRPSERESEEPASPAASLSLRLEPDQFCALCGADSETDETLVSGFLDVLVMTPAAGPALRKVCDACASILRQQIGIR
jgi:hypothetical protein